MCMIIDENNNALDFYLNAAYGDLEFQFAWLRNFRYAIMLLHRFVKGYEEIGDNREKIANEVNLLFTACCVKTAEEAAVVWDNPLAVFALHQDHVRYLMRSIEMHIDVQPDPENSMKFIATPILHGVQAHNAMLYTLQVKGYSADACRLLLSLLLLYHFRFHRAYSF
jgi:hypothetical protein